MYITHLFRSGGSVCGRESKVEKYSHCAGVALATFAGPSTHHDAISQNAKGVVFTIHGYIIPTGLEAPSLAIDLYLPIA